MAMFSFQKKAKEEQAKMTKVPFPKKQGQGLVPAKLVKKKETITEVKDVEPLDQLIAKYNIPFIPALRAFPTEELRDIKYPFFAKTEKPWIPITQIDSIPVFAHFNPSLSNDDYCCYPKELGFRVLITEDDYEKILISVKATLFSNTESGNSVNNAWSQFKFENKIDELSNVKIVQKFFSKNGWLDVKSIRHKYAWEQLIQGKPVLPIADVDVVESMVHSIDRNILNNYQAYPYYEDKTLRILCFGIGNVDRYNPTNFKTNILSSLKKNGISDYSHIYAFAGDAKKIIDRVARCLSRKESTYVSSREDEEGEKSGKFVFNLDQSEVNVNVGIREIEGARQRVEWCFLRALALKANDIHFCHFVGLNPIQMRVNKDLSRVGTITDSELTVMAQYIKDHSFGINIDTSNMPQDGRITLIWQGNEIDCRVSTLPLNDDNEESIVIRLLYSENNITTFEQLRLPPVQELDLKDTLLEANGLILITGPTGSGKTTTINVSLQYIRDYYSGGAVSESAAFNGEVIPECSKKIYTLEDPVEYKIANISQHSLNPKIGRTYGVALRSLLRQDPDIIMVGEIRDQETASIACEAALTGHLVMSTLHTNSATGIISRLSSGTGEIQVDRDVLGEALKLMYAQRVMPSLCPNCKITNHAVEKNSAEYRYIYDYFQFLESRMGVEEDRMIKFPSQEVDNLILKINGFLETGTIEHVKENPSGCGNCSRGYTGMSAYSECFIIDDDAKDIIHRAGSKREMDDHYYALGKLPMSAYMVNNYLNGITSFNAIRSEIKIR